MGAGLHGRQKYQQWNIEGHRRTVRPRYVIHCHVWTITHNSRNSRAGRPTLCFIAIIITKRQCRKPGLILLCYIYHGHRHDVCLIVQDIEEQSRDDITSRFRDLHLQRAPLSTVPSMNHPSPPTQPPTSSLHLNLPPQFKYNWDITISSSVEILDTSIATSLDDLISGEHTNME